MHRIGIYKPELLVVIVEMACSNGSDRGGELGSEQIRRHCRRIGHDSDSCTGRVPELKHLESVHPFSNVHLRMRWWR